MLQHSSKSSESSVIRIVALHLAGQDAGMRWQKRARRCADAYNNDVRTSLVVGKPRQHCCHRVWACVWRLRTQSQKSRWQQRGMSGLCVQRQQCACKLFYRVRCSSHADEGTRSQRHSAAVEATELREYYEHSSIPVTIDIMGNKRLAGQRLEPASVKGGAVYDSLPPLKCDDNRTKSRKFSLISHHCAAGLWIVLYFLVRWCRVARIVHTWFRVRQVCMYSRMWRQQVFGCGIISLFWTQFYQTDAQVDKNNTEIVMYSTI